MHVLETDPNDEARVARERAYHNERFAYETREAQAKYYFAIKDGAETFGARVRAAAIDARVLEYGCGDSNQAGELAGLARTFTGIDISDVAIGEAREKAAALGLSNTSFHVMNAEQMDFADGAFELVFGRGIVHHLDIEKCFSEVSRVLAPGGRALFWEPLGHNVLMNLYRAMTPNARTPDEHPLLKRDFDVARKYFADVKLDFYGLSTLGAVPFRNKSFGESLLRGARGLDRALFRAPGVKWQAWYVLMDMTKHG